MHWGDGVSYDISVSVKPLDTEEQVEDCSRSVTVIQEKVDGLNCVTVALPIRINLDPSVQNCICDFRGMQEREGVFLSLIVITTKRLIIAVGLVSCENVRVTVITLVAITRHTTEDTAEVGELFIIEHFKGTGRSIEQLTDEDFRVGEVSRSSQESEGENYNKLDGLPNMTTKVKNVMKLISGKLIKNCDAFHKEEELCVVHYLTSAVNYRGNFKKTSNTS